MNVVRIPSRVYRDGFCHTDELDRGIHVVCAEMSEEF